MRRLTIGLMMLATSGFAQDTNQVTLKYDDGSGVSGELLEYKDDMFRLQASVGLIAIPAQDVSCIGAACPPGTTLEVPPAPVTLVSHDGKISLSGNVIEFVNNEYVLATDIGEIRISADLTSCTGAGCVTPSEPPSREVVLTNGSATIEGLYVGLENGTYIIEVDALGKMRVDASSFECTGAACP